VYVLWASLKKYVLTARMTQIRFLHEVKRMGKVVSNRLRVAPLKLQNECRLNLALGSEQKYV
jgi:hypothetical protein